MCASTGTSSKESFLTHVNDKYKNPHNRQKTPKTPDAQGEIME